LGIEVVRIQRRVSRKRYLNSKRVYEYERISLHIPKKLHEIIKPYLKEDLDLKVATEKDSLIFILTPLKTLRHAANDPAKTQQKGSGQTWLQHRISIFVYMSARRTISPLGNFCPQKHFPPDL